MPCSKLFFAVFLLLADPGGATHCQAAMNGMYEHCVFECSQYDDPTTEECCDNCGSQGTCGGPGSDQGCCGICLANVPGVGPYPGGNGNITKDGSHCQIEFGATRDGFLRDDAPCHIPISSGYLQDGMLIYPKGAKGNNLGRPGVCIADPYHLISGTTLAAHSRVVKSVGECCDICANVNECGGWSMNMSTWSCSIIENSELLQRQFCSHCYSGLKQPSVVVV